MTYQQKLAELKKVQDNISHIARVVNSKEAQISQRESLLRQGQTPNNTAQQLRHNMSNAVGPLLQPGNINDINSIIWPYFFTTDTPDSGIASGETFQTGFSVTQEAAFIFMSYTKSVYLLEGEEPNESITYLEPGDQPSAPGLTFTLRDGSSSRQFYNQPINIDGVGNPRFPTKFPRPIMLLPNQVMQIAFANSHSSNVYLPKISVFGYRMRIDDARRLLSLVYA